MTYREFITKLNIFGYKHSSYVANEMEFITWTFNTINRLDDPNPAPIINRVSVGYVLDGDVIRQQFSDKVNIVQLHKFTKGTSGFWSNYSYQECIDELIDLKLLSVEAFRDNKLEQLGI
jgi:hypothetical protein